MNKNKKVKYTIIVAGLVVVLGIGIFLSIFFNVRSTKIPPNPAGTTGNTAGNINNGGLFAESNGVVYFANSFDDDTLYCMNSDETNIKKISSAQISNLLVAGDYLYFFQLGTSGNTGLGSVRAPRSFNRCRLDGSKSASVVRETVIKAQLVDNTLYMLASGDNGSYFFRIETNGSDRTALADYIINPAACYNGLIYYNGTVSDHYLYSLNPKGDIVTPVLEYNMWNPVVYNGYVYFMDLNNDYRLCRYNLGGDSVEILAKDRVQAFNVGSGYVYYQTMGENAGLYCMLCDGSQSIQLAYGEFCDISMTSQYVYFKNYFDQAITYHSPIGSATYESFTAAGKAALEGK